ncbi:MAG: hypothetical protein IAG13_12485 [Deltaproteobacteria bacterium]|nr:hypothetical protein [Nannocystaceae bacterium]
MTRGFITCSRALSLLAFASIGACNDDDGEPSASSDSTAAADLSTGDTPDAPASGPLACPAGESCTLVLVAQTLDDRVDIFAARGAGPLYRGAIDIDFKPNPMGDNSGENLDEPFGMAIDEQGLAMLVGHYPTRQSGSMLLFPHDLLAMQGEGETLAASSYFAGGVFSAGVRDLALGEEEPIFVRAHPSGRLLVGVFANDLFALESAWTNPGKLLVVDPVSGEVGTRVLDTGAMRCAGAWSVVPLDAATDTIGIGCDGDEGAVILDVSAVGEGTVAEAAAAITGCAMGPADVPFPDRRVRWLAPDGEGGILLAETGQTYDPNGGKLWRFDSACESVSPAAPLDAAIWEARELVHVPNDAGPRWLMAVGRMDRGVHVLRDGASGAEICNKLDDLEPYWTADDGGDIVPFALALDRGAQGLAIGVGPSEAASDAPGYGRVLWVELDASIDPCEASPITSVIDLTASAPAVAPEEPSTWRRAPSSLLVQQYG